MYRYEDSILSDCVAKQSEVTVFLINGFQIKGLITGFDDAVVILADYKGKVHTIYKHAISTVTR